MGKHQSLQTHHFYLGAGGMLAVAALVIALTFGLSSAQTTCPSGQHWDSHSNACVADTMPTTCPSGYTGTPPNCVSSTPTTSPTMPAGGCGSGMYWNGTSCVASSPTPMTCPTGQHSEWMNGVQSCVADMHNTATSPPAGGCVAPTSYWNGTSCIAPPVMPTTGTTPPSCPTGQWWDYSRGMCVSSSTTTTCTVGQIYCPAVGTFAAGCYTNTCPTIGQSCPTGQWWDPARNACSSGTSITPTTCPTGQWWDPARNACSSGTSITPTTCPSGQWWDPAKNACSSGTTTMNCDWSTQYWKSSTTSCQPRTNCTTIGSVDYNTSECQGVRNTSGTPTPTTCPTGQWWDSSKNACTSTTATTCPTGQWWDSAKNACSSGTTGQMWCQSLNKQATAAECEAATPVCTAGQTPGTANCRYQSCPSGQWWDPAAGVCKTSGDQGQYCPPMMAWDSATKVCKPTTGGQTCPSGQWWDPAKNACTSTTTGDTGGMYSCFYPNATKNGKNPGFTVWCERDYVNCREGSKTGASITLDDLALGAPSTCERGWSMTGGQNCPSGQWWDSAKNACSGTTYTSGCTSTEWWDPASQSCKPMENYKPTCGPMMQSCPDPWISGSTMCMPKTRGGYWDMASNKMIGGQDVTCEVLINEMKNPPVPVTIMPRDMRVCGPNEYPTPQNPCRMEGGPNLQLDCSRDYNNPFCRSGKFGKDVLDHIGGEDIFKDIGNEKIKISTNLFQEVQQLKSEALAKNKSQCLGGFGGPGPGPYPLPMVPMMTPAHGGFGGSFGGPVAGPGGDPFSGSMPYFPSLECDLLQAQQRIKETSLASGISCPVTGQIQTVIDQVQVVLEEIRSLNAKTATADQVSTLRGKLNALRGGGIDGSPGVLGKLNGWWNNQTQKYEEGLLRSLDSCREIGFLTRDAQRMLDEHKFLSNSPSYKELQAFASNPLAYLPAGVDIFAPWQAPQDYTVCMPDPKEEEAMRAKMEAEMEKRRTQGHGMCGYFDSPYKQKDECIPPVQRYLGFPNGKLAQLSKAFMEASCTRDENFEGKYACEGFAMAPQKMKEEAKFMALLAPKVRERIEELVAAGTAACAAGDNGKATGLMEELMGLVSDHEDIGDEDVEFDLVDEEEMAIDQAKQEGKELDGKEVADLKETIRKLKEDNASLGVEIQKLTTAFVQLGDELGKVKADFELAQSQLARLMSDENTSAMAQPLVARAEELLNHSQEIFDTLDGYKGVAEGEKYVQEALQLASGGISAATEDVISKQADALVTTLHSGVLSSKEAVKKCKEFKEFVKAATNPDQEVDRLRAEGIPVFKGAPLNHWVGSFVLEGAVEGLISTENKEFNPGGAATGNHVLVRTVRDLASKNPEVAAELAKLDDVENKSSIPLAKEVPGLADWARPFAKVAEGLDVSYPEVKGFSLSDQIERDETAALKVRIYEAGLKGTEYIVPEGDVPVPPDVAKNPFAHEIRVAIEMGIFSGCSAGDKNFCPDRGLNLGEEIVTAVKAADEFSQQAKLNEAVSAERESADEEDFDFGDDDFEEESEDF